jgi:hypothetical protein
MKLWLFIFVLAACSSSSPGGGEWERTILCSYPDGGSPETEITNDCTSTPELMLQQCDAGCALAVIDAGCPPSSPCHCTSRAAWSSYDCPAR